MDAGIGGEPVNTFRKWRAVGVLAFAEICALAVVMWATAYPGGR
jgi:hypothetical protein